MNEIFFFLSKLFALIAFPYPLLLILFLFFILRSSRKVPYLFLWGIITFFSSNAGAGLLIGTLESNYSGKTIAETETAGAIVVLGGMIEASGLKYGRPEFLSSVDRYLAGLQLLKNKKAPILIFSGGAGTMLQNSAREADLLKNYTVENNLATGEIIAENNSRNTRENAVETKIILEKKNIKKVILVTSAFHMTRSVLVFKKEKLEIIPFPVDFKKGDSFVFPEDYFPTSHGLDKFTTGFREIIGIIAYTLAGYTF